MIYDSSLWFTTFTLFFTGFVFWFLLYLGFWSTSFIIRLIRDHLR